MSNTGIYLQKEVKEKLERISIKCQTSQSKAINTMIKQLDENWISDIIKTYKNQ